MRALAVVTVSVACAAPAPSSMNPTAVKMHMIPPTALVTAVKFCIDERGDVSSMRFVKSSGSPAYDRNICEKVREWRYAPYRIDGRATPACVPLLIYQARGDLH